MSPVAVDEPLGVHLALAGVVLERVLLGGVLGDVLVGLVVDDDELVAVAEDEVDAAVGERRPLERPRRRRRG